MSGMVINMATANINLADGTKVVIDGSPEEIARVLILYRQTPTSSLSAEMLGNVGNGPVVQSEATTRRADSKSRASSGAMPHIRGLIADGFFDERRSLAAVQSKLEEDGRIYPLTHLSTPLRRLVVNKELRRLRNGKNWVYVTAR